MKQIVLKPEARIHTTVKFADLNLKLIGFKDGQYCFQAVGDPPLMLYPWEFDIIDSPDEERLSNV